MTSDSREHEPDWQPVDLEPWKIMLVDLCRRVASHHCSESDDSVVEINEEIGKVRMTLSHFNDQLEFGVLAESIMFGIVNGQEAFKEKYDCEPWSSA